MLAGGVALTPTYASYNKQQLAITKLAIKSVARLTKIAHWAERQFDFEVFFFLFFARFLFVFFLLLFCLLFLFCCRCCLLVVSGLRLCIRDVVVACRLSGMWTVPGDYEVIQMKCLRRPLHHRPGLDYCIFLRCFVVSLLSLCIFSFIFCVDCAQKCGNFVCRKPRKFMKIIVATSSLLSFHLFTFARRWR